METRGRIELALAGVAIQYLTNRTPRHLFDGLFFSQNAQKSHARAFPFRSAPAARSITCMYRVLTVRNPDLESAWASTFVHGI